VDATGEREGEERRRQSTVSFSQDLQDFEQSCKSWFYIFC
jgi:hypothetical protein